MPAIPAALSRAPEWQVVDVICNGLFPHDPRIWAHINLQTGNVDFEAILEEGTYSTGERLALTAAASMWSGSGHPVSLGQVANHLDDHELHYLLLALAAYRGEPLPLSNSGSSPKTPAASAN